MEAIDPGSPRPHRWQGGPPAEEASPVDEFVGFSLGRVGFIMRRAPFFAAVHRGPAAEPARADSASYVDSLLRFNDRDVPLFSLDDLLRNIFRITEASQLRAGLVARVDAFGPAAAEAFRAAARDRLPGADTEYIAFGIGGDGAIRNLPWRELRPVPSSLRRFLWTRGIVACRFGGHGLIEYLIDPADICLPVLEGQGATA